MLRHALLFCLISVFILFFVCRLLKFAHFFFRNQQYSFDQQLSYVCPPSFERTYFTEIVAVNIRPAGISAITVPTYTADTGISGNSAYSDSFYFKNVCYFYTMLARQSGQFIDHILLSRTVRGLDFHPAEHTVTGFLEQFLVDPSGEDVPAQADDQPFFLFRRVKKAAFEYSVMILIVRSNFS